MQPQPQPPPIPFEHFSIHFAGVALVCLSTFCSCHYHYYWLQPGHTIYGVCVWSVVVGCGRLFVSPLDELERACVVVLPLEGGGGARKLGPW